MTAPAARAVLGVAHGGGRVTRSAPAPGRPPLAPSGPVAEAQQRHHRGHHVVLGVYAPAGRWGGAPMTERQREVLQRAGLPVQGLDRGQASGLIDAIVARSQAGVCTFKQARVLLRFGLSPDVSFGEASETLDRLTRNGWRRAPVSIVGEPAGGPQSTVTRVGRVA